LFYLLPPLLPAERLLPPPLPLDEKPPPEDEELDLLLVEKLPLLLELVAGLLEREEDADEVVLLLRELLLFEVAGTVERVLVSELTAVRLCVVVGREVRVVPPTDWSLETAPWRVEVIFSREFVVAADRVDPAVVDRVVFTFADRLFVFTLARLVVPTRETDSDERAVLRLPTMLVCRPLL
jgi:hypothetical protein